jgi:hypothetical protein
MFHEPQHQITRRSADVGDHAECDSDKHGNDESGVGLSERMVKVSICQEVSSSCSLNSEELTCVIIVGGPGSMFVELHPCLKTLFNPLRNRIYTFNHNTDEICIYLISA